MAATATTTKSSSASTTTNPFRSPAITPVPTGTLTSSSPPRIEQPTSSNSSSNSAAHDVNPPDFSDEEPPAYTPRADMNREETLEFGPRRPFQAQPQPHLLSPSQPPLSPPPPPIISSHYQTPPRHQTGSSGSLWRQLTGHIDQIAAQLTGPASSVLGHGRSQSANSAGYPGAQYQHQRQQHTGTTYAPPPGPPPPSQYNIQAPPLPPRRASFSGSAPPAASSDFARDFYAVGGDAAIPQPHSAPPSPSTNQSTRPTPTVSPTPGHPLLRDGKLLVYPEGFQCDKCRNTGFKHADPSHPCRKCWSKHSKPFSGPLAYAYSSHTPFEDSSAFQRPLPSFRSPSSSRLPSRTLKRSASSTHPHHSYTGSSGAPSHSPSPSPSCTGPPTTRRPPPPAPAPIPTPVPIFDSPHPRLHPQPHQGGYPAFPTPQSFPPRLGATFHTISPSSALYRTGNPLAPLSRTTPLANPGSNSVVYNAGDPRMGGMLCWRCEGTGTVSFMIFDEATCEACGGIGRVFR